jgi:hypothetical protein
MVQAGLDKKRDPISKITRAKRSEGMSQVKALNLKPHYYE